eukprot:844828_1
MLPVVRSVFASIMGVATVVVCWILFDRRKVHPLSGRPIPLVILSQLSVMAYGAMQLVVSHFVEGTEHEHADDMDMISEDESTATCYIIVSLNSFLTVFSLTIYGIRIIMLWAAHKTTRKAMKLAESDDARENKVSTNSMIVSLARSSLYLVFLAVTLLFVQSVPFVYFFAKIVGSPTEENPCHSFYLKFSIVDKVLDLIWAIVLTYGSIKYVKINDTFYLNSEITTVSVVIAIRSIAVGIPAIVHEFILVDTHFDFVFWIILASTLIMFYYSSVLPAILTFRNFTFSGRTSNFTDAGDIPATLIDLLSTKEGIEDFRKHLEREFCVENLLFYTEVDSIRKLAVPTRGQMEYIVSEYIVENSPLQVNLSQEMVEEINKYMMAHPKWIDPDIFREAQSEVLKLMRQNNFQSYIRQLRIA